MAVNKINVAIGKAVSNLRLESSLSQEDLADAAGIHRTYVSQIERGLKSPTLHVYIKIANALNVKPSAIMHLLEENLDEIHSKQ